jgi:hypothetical protein
MRKSLTLCTLALTALLTAPAFGEDAKKEPSPAQKAARERMSNCSKDAREQSLKGDERKSFMRQCLSAGKADTPEAMAAREKKSACRKEAKAQGLKGDERKKFLSECVGA